MPSSRRMRVACVVALVVAVVGAWLAVETGQREEERVEAVVPEAPFKAHGEAAEQFLAFSGVFLLVAGAGLLGGAVGRAARYVSVVGAIGLLAAGVRVGHTGGQLVYSHGAASAYVSGAATTDQERPNGRSDDDRRQSEHEGTR